MLIEVAIGFTRPHLGGALWFLTSLLTVSILFLVIRIAFKSIKIKNDLVMLIPSIICLYIGYKTQLPYKISVSLISLFFYHLGYIFTKYKDFVKFKPLYMVVAFLLIFATSLINYIDLAANTYTYFSLFIFSSIVGSYFILGISKYINKSNIMEYLGRNTLPIIAYHFVAFININMILVLIYKLPMSYIISYPTIKDYPQWWFAYSIAGAVFPLCINKISKKINLS